MGPLNGTISKQLSRGQGYIRTIHLSHSDVRGGLISHHACVLRGHLSLCTTYSPFKAPSSCFSELVFDSFTFTIPDQGQFFSDSPPQSTPRLPHICFAEAIGLRIAADRQFLVPSQIYHIHCPSSGIYRASLGNSALVQVCGRKERCALFDKIDCPPVDNTLSLPHLITSDRGYLSHRY